MSSPGYRLIYKFTNKTTNDRRQTVSGYIILLGCNMSFRLSLAFGAPFSLRGHPLLEIIALLNATRYYT